MSKEPEAIDPNEGCYGCILALALMLTMGAAIAAGAAWILDLMA